MAAEMNFNLNSYLDFERLDDDEYLKEKHLIKKNKDNVTILKYNKNALTCETIGSLGLFRSICIKNNKVVGFAPQKAYSSEHFYDIYSSPEDFNDLIFEEFVEGTMINLFWNDDDWKISTRSLVGAKGQFFKGGKTFDRMFLEAMNESTLEFDDLNKEYSYSFVFQHPENRIVVPCKKPSLYLCGVYKITDNIVELIHFRDDIDLCSKVNIPQRYSGYTNWFDVKNQFASTQGIETPYYIVGVMLFDKTTGIRSKIRNPSYETVRKLRGNQPKIQFQYYNLRRQSLVRDYLKYYPEFKETFSKLRQQLHTYTNMLHHNYLNCFVYKEKPLKEYPHEFRTHMYSLHQKYINELIPEGKCINKYVVMTYVNTLEPARLMYTMNYNVRKYQRDIKKKELETNELETNEPETNELETNEPETTDKSSDNSELIK